MPSDRDVSLSDEATFAGRPRPQRSDVSLGDEQTLGDGLSGQDTIIDDIEVVDLDARYRIEGELGQGGMGAVLLATDTRLDRKVAIKRILGEAAGNRMAVQRFLTEAKSIAALNHPNVVQIYDYGRAKDGPFLIMEFVDGGSLLDRCRDGAMPLEDTVDMACQLCDGLAKAHDLGIVHRDIKPANVLLTKDGVPKLTDFGLAKAQAGDHGQTMTGAVLGTPDFMPPEQRRDAALVDHRSDLWSLAATVYQMVTGRSPKIIRFDLLPAELTKVLGKALEEEKEARYQSARELRDALKTGLRTVAAVDELIAGACPACGVKNESSRRFCRGCGESLEAPCLSCAQAMPMWEEICGACGGKQGQLVVERREAMAARQAEAEGLLGDCDFERAAAIAAELRDEPHRRLKHLAGRGVSLLKQIEKARGERTREALQAIEEARKHEAAFDHASAISALESVPRPLWGAALPGARERVADSLDRLRKAQANVRRLDADVKERLATKAVDDLLPIVEELLRLQPNREDLRKLRTQLEERNEKLIAARDEAIRQARARLAERDYENARNILQAIRGWTRNQTVDRLQEEASRLIAETRGLAEHIRRAVAGKQLDGLLNTVESYLKLQPADDDMQTLRRSLLEREEKYAAEISRRLEKAQELGRRGRFAEAVTLLERISAARRSADVAACLDLSERLADLRLWAMDALSRAKTERSADALEHGRHYRAELERAGLGDEEFAAVMADAEAAHARHIRMRKIARYAAASAAGMAAAVTLLTAGLWLRGSVRAASLANAIANRRWDDALAIDSSNLAALVGRARAKVQADPADIDGAFADLERAGRLPGAAAQSDLTDATVEAWLAQGRQASSRNDAAAIRTAVRGALAAGAATAAVNPLEARALTLDAVAAQNKGHTKPAVAAILEASLRDVSIVGATIQEPTHASLRPALVVGLRAAFDAAVGTQDWDRSRNIAAAAEALDGSAGGWINAALASSPPAALASLPTPMLATLPPATMASLPADAMARLPPLRNSIGMEMRLLPAGTFTMGQAGRMGEGETPHRVTLTKPFYIGIYEVTNLQWRQVVGDLPKKWRWKDDQRPAGWVSWEEAVEFCRKLSALPDEQRLNRAYRLPREAEWEYACRAGTTTKYSCGDDPARLGEYAWFSENSGKQTYPVGRTKPNAWGLFDMHGNVAEWCADWNVLELGDAAVTDPGAGNDRQPPGTDGRVYRGGSWYAPAERCRSAYRYGHDVAPGGNDQGFRVVLPWSESRKENQAP